MKLTRVKEFCKEHACAIGFGVATAISTAVMMEVCVTPDESVSRLAEFIFKAGYVSFSTGLNTLNGFIADELRK